MMFCCLRWGIQFIAKSLWRLAHWHLAQANPQSVTLAAALAYFFVTGRQELNSYIWVEVSSLGLLVAALACNESKNSEWATEPPSIFNGGQTITAPVGGNRSRFVMHCKPYFPAPCMK